MVAWLLVYYNEIQVIVMLSYTRYNQYCSTDKRNLLFKEKSMSQGTEDHLNYQYLTC